MRGVGGANPTPRTPACALGAPMGVAYVARVPRARAFAAGLVLAALLGTCGGEPTTTASSASVVTKEMVFSPDVMKAEHGRLTINVRNTGALKHTFSLNSLGKEVTVNPGETKKIRVDVAPGTYAYVCRILDHEGLGMHGTLTVT